MLLQDGETPLIRATQKKHTAIVSLLLEKGASVSVADKVRDVFCPVPCFEKRYTERRSACNHSSQFQLIIKKAGDKIQNFIK